MTKLTPRVDRTFPKGVRILLKSVNFLEKEQDEKI
nr:MAG TPA: hypothetical protein [Caudoviricetes sp.]